MPLITYVSKNFTDGTLRVIQAANDVIDDIVFDQGYTLTLRQLYYQLVASNQIANTDQEYKRLGSIISDARLAGLVDWEAIVDRTRELKDRSAWRNPESIVSACARDYALDLWEGQEHRVEVWVEKEALEEVADRAAVDLNCPCFACRGYTSQSAMWLAAQRFHDYQRDGHDPVIIHLGDHDPSGLDMSRDIRERLEMFGIPVKVLRVALNMDQVDKLKLPPNPAKVSDSRAPAYIVEFGRYSWELDALAPKMLHKVIQKGVRSFMDVSLFKKRKVQQEQERKTLEDISDNYHDIVHDYLGHEEE